MKFIYLVSIKLWLVSSCKGSHFYILTFNVNDSIFLKLKAYWWINPPSSEPSAFPFLALCNTFPLVFQVYKNSCPLPISPCFFFFSSLCILIFLCISVQTSCYMSLENTQYSLLALNPLSFIFTCKNVFPVLATSTFLLDSLLKPILTMFIAQPLPWKTHRVPNGHYLTHPPNKSSLFSSLTHKW